MSNWRILERQIKIDTKKMLMENLNNQVFLILSSDSVCSSEGSFCKLISNLSALLTGYIKEDSNCFETQ